MCCCTTCSGARCVANFVRGCSSCDPEGCGRKGIPGNCNAGVPSWHSDSPPEATYCLLPTAQKQKAELGWCCCQSCSAGGCAAHFEMGCSSCDTQGCYGKASVNGGMCNSGIPTWKVGGPPESLFCA